MYAQRPAHSRCSINNRSDCVTMEIVLRRRGLGWSVFFLRNLLECYTGFSNLKKPWDPTKGQFAGILSTLDSEMRFLAENKPIAAKCALFVHREDAPAHLFRRSRLLGPLFSFRYALYPGGGLFDTWWQNESLELYSAMRGSAEGQATVSRTGGVWPPRLGSTVHGSKQWQHQASGLRGVRIPTPVFVSPPKVIPSKHVIFPRELSRQTTFELLPTPLIALKSLCSTEISEPHWRQEKLWGT